MLKRFFQRILSQDIGQDLIEYALMAGFVAVAAGAIMPGVADSVKRVFDRVHCVMAASSGYHWVPSQTQVGGTCVANAPKGQ